MADQHQRQIRKRPGKGQRINSGKLSFGHVKIGDQGSKKSVDEIRMESVLTYKTGLFSPYAAATGQTQLTAGYDYSLDPRVQVSDLFDPAYLTQTPAFSTSRRRSSKHVWALRSRKR
jgi:hypothetical protein